MFLSDRVLLHFLRIFFICFAGFCLAQNERLPCQNTEDMTQLELNECARQEYLDADRMLNEVYRGIREKHKDDSLFLESLRDAQRAWVAFRDAEMAALFPHAKEHRYYGSIFPMCWSQHLTRLTRNRIDSLRVWLDGVPEGSVCSGSYPVGEGERPK